MLEILKVAVVVVVSSVAASAILTKLLIVFAHRVESSAGPANRSTESGAKATAV